MACQHSTAGEGIGRRLQQLPTWGLPEGIACVLRPRPVSQKMRYCTDDGIWPHGGLAVFLFAALWLYPCPSREWPCVSALALVESVTAQDSVPCALHSSLLFLPPPVRPLDIFSRGYIRLPSAMGRGETNKMRHRDFGPGAPAAWAAGLTGLTGAWCPSSVQYACSRGCSAPASSAARLSSHARRGTLTPAPCLVSHVSQRRHSRAALGQQLCLLWRASPAA